MGTPTRALKQAIQDFVPDGEPTLNKNWGELFTACYVSAWDELQESYEKEQEKQNEPPTLEERVEVLEEQVRQLRELIQP